ncbi:unnamed protein product, partial [Ectocarpus sp. 12 AP-2014]
VAALSSATIPRTFGNPSIGSRPCGLAHQLLSPSFVTSIAAYIKTSPNKKRHHHPCLVFGRSAIHPPPTRTTTPTAVPRPPSRRHYHTYHTTGAKGKDGHAVTKRNSSPTRPKSPAS